MKLLAEILRIDRRPVGMIRQDSNSKQIGFSPLRGKLQLPQRRWGHVDELKQAVIQAYQKKTPATTEAPKSLPGLSIKIVQREFDQ